MSTQLVQKVKQVCPIKVDGLDSVVEAVQMVNATLGGNLTVTPTEQWEALLTSSVTAALENSSIEVTVGDTVSVVVSTANGPVEVTGTVTANVTGDVTIQEPLSVTVTDFPTTMSIDNFADIGTVAVNLVGQDAPIEVELSGPQQQLLINISDAINGIVRPQYTPTGLCVLGPSGVAITPPVKQYHERRYDNTGGLISDVIVLSQFLPDGSVVGYTLGEDETVGVENDLNKQPVLTTRYCLPRNFGQDTQSSLFEDIAGATIDTAIEFDVPEDGLFRGAIIRLNGLATTGGVQTSVSFVLTNEDTGAEFTTNSINTFGGVFPHEFLLDTPVQMQRGEFYSLRAVVEDGGIAAEVQYNGTTTRQVASFRGGGPSNPMITFLVDGFDKFSRVTFDDKSELIFDGDGTCIDELPRGVLLESDVPEAFGDVATDFEPIGPICYEVPNEDVELNFSIGDGVIAGNGVINYPNLNNTGIGATVSSSTNTIVGQSIGPLFNFNGTGRVTIRFTEPVTIGEMTVRASVGEDALYSNFSVPPVGASAGFELDTGVVIVADGETAPVDGIIDFGGVAVTELSFDINQSDSTTHINNITGVKQSPTLRYATAFYENNVLIEHRDTVSDAVVDLNVFNVCPAGSSDSSPAVVSTNEPRVVDTLQYFIDVEGVTTPVFKFIFSDGTFGPETLLTAESPNAVEFT